MSKLPPDRSDITTEHRNSRSMILHNMSTAQLVELMNSEDNIAIEAVKHARGAITSFIGDLQPRFESGGRLIYIGAGTSGRLGVLDASEIPPTFQIEHGRIIGIIAGGDRALRKSSEGLEDDSEGAWDELKSLKLTDRDTLLGIAAGSTTPYVVGALRIAQEIAPGMLTGFLTCSQARTNLHADHVIHLNTGPELITGSTRLKAGTATKLTLNIISNALMIKSGRVYQNLMVDLRATNEKLRDRAARIIGTLTGLERSVCFTLLDQANGIVKTALVMHFKQVDSVQADKILANHQGRLNRILEE